MKLVWLLLGLQALSNSSSIKQPNIVFIVADDMGYQDVGFRGSNIRTPNIDRLAREGVILENHYVMSVCAPTRASLMTGRYPIRTGFWKGNLNSVEKFGLGLNETLLPEMLKRNGYVTHGVGKWHCGAYSWDHTPVKRGFDTFFGLFQGGQDYYSHRHQDWLDLREDYYDAHGHFVDDIRDDLDDRYNTYLFTNRSVELIRNHDKSRPLFLYLAYTAPHGPDQAPTEDMERFTSDSNQNYTKIYATMVSIMDEGIGKVAEELKEQGIMNDTILVFTSDNGAKYSSHGSNYPLRGGKGTLLEGGVRGVTFVNSPLLQNTGYTNTHLHHVTDWYATFQKLTNDNPVEHDKIQLPIDGVDIWGSIDGNTSCREEVLLNLRVPSKYLSTPCEECLELSSLQVQEGNHSNSQKFNHTNSQDLDFFALRWQKWKLIAGRTFRLLGWSSKNNEEGHLNFTDGEGVSLQQSVGSGTLLFDLSCDVREENNVAEQYPDIVANLLRKKQGYLDKMISIKHRKFANISMEGGVFRPWVIDLTNDTTEYYT